MKYKAIGFDYGGVIYGEPSSKFVSEISNFLGVSEDEFNKAWWQHNHKSNKGTSSLEDVWRDVLDHLGIAGKLQPTLELIQKIDSVKNINKAVIELVNKLKKNGYKVGLLSNNTPEGAAKMRTLGINKYFDVFDISCEIGLMKPEPAAYKKFAKDLGVDLSELVFVDDTKEALQGSEDLGYKAILFTGTKGLIKDLNAL